MKSLVIFNVTLTDSEIDSSGMVICSGEKIKSVLLGDFKTKKSAELAISAILSESEVKSAEFFDGKGQTLMPAFIDLHVHFRDPGLTQKEDLESGLNAAAAGGYGTVVAMPNTNPVISSQEDALENIKRAEKIGLARLFQTTSITKNFDGKTVTDIDSYDASKIPVISEDGHDVGDTAVMLSAMQKAGKKGIVVSCHCEDVSLAQAAKPFRQRALEFMKQYNIPAGKVNVKTPNVPAAVDFEIDGNLKSANDLLAIAENTMTSRNIQLASLAGCHIHICHCSTKVCVNSVRLYKGLKNLEGFGQPGFDLTMEVTPHHIGLTGTEAPYIRALVNPPLRSEEDRRAIIKGIIDGTVDAIATDHAPHTQEDKAAGSPGFTGLELAFAVCHSVLVKREGISLKKLSALMSANPAKILGLKAGLFKPGYDADFALVDTEEEWVVNPEKFYSKGKSTPFEGQTVTGKVKATFNRGQQVFPRLR